MHMHSCMTQFAAYASRSTGKERDTESGNDYFGARYYASSMGRFLSPDWSAKVMPVPYAKLDNPQSLNLYSYVWNNPLSRNDPDGHVVALTCAASTSSSQCSQDKSTELQRLAANASKTDKNGLSESSLFKPTTDKNGNTTMTLDKKAAANFKGEHSAGYNLLTSAIDAKPTVSVSMSDQFSKVTSTDPKTGNVSVRLERGVDAADAVAPMRNGNLFQIIAGHEVLGHALDFMLGDKNWAAEGPGSPTFEMKNILRKEQNIGPRLPNE